MVGLAAAAFGGCGDDDGVPSDGVAKVGDTVIKKSDFDRWIKANAAGAGQGGPATVPDPPNFTKCAEAKSRQPQSRGAGKPSAEQFKQLCKLEYDQRKGLVMKFLIEAEWAEQEAAAKNVKVSDAEVKRSFEAQKRSAFPDPKAFQKYLKSSGMTEREILYRLRINTLQQKLSQKVPAGPDAKKASDAEIRRYYEKNKKRFAQPELRTLNAVVTKTKGEADRAKSALERGQSFAAVSKRYSIDQASKQQDGKLLVAKGQQSRAPEAVFRARKGQLRGPVKAPLGYYVFEVTKVTPASKPSFQQAKLNVRNQLSSQRRQKNVEAYMKRFSDKYRALTVCAKGYLVAQCKNGPKEEAGSRQGGGTQPQGGAQGGQPPQPQGGQPPQPQGGQPPQPRQQPSR